MLASLSLWPIGWGRRWWNAELKGGQRADRRQSAPPAERLAQARQGHGQARRRRQRGPVAWLVPLAPPPL
eukprot:3264695-Pleurochrysis_carterae.AAC.1